LMNALREFFKNKYSRMYMIGIVALILLANIAVVAFRLIYGANEGTYAYNIIEYATWCFVIPYYSCIFIADIGTHCLGAAVDNSSSVQSFLGKFLLNIMMSVVFMLIAVISLFAITCLFHLNDGLMEWYDVTDFLGKMMIAVPLWLAGLSFATMFMFIFEKKRYAYIAFFVLTLIIPRVIMLFAAEPFSIGLFRFLRTYTITQNMSLIPYPADPARNVLLTIILGIIYTIVGIAVACIYCNKKQKHPQE